MANIDEKMRYLLGWSLVTVLFLTWLGFYLYWNAQYKDNLRRLKEITAKEQVLAEKRQRLLEYQKRLREQELRRQYNQGRVVDISTPPAQ